jgi:hypothetical protein
MFPLIAYHLEFAASYIHCHGRSAAGNDTKTVDGAQTGSSAYQGWISTRTDDDCYLLTESEREP